MGTVSTALSEEALLKSLKLSTFNHPTENSGGVGLKKDDDVKCSICQVSIISLSYLKSTLSGRLKIIYDHNMQEEYVDGDELGTLPCQHMYHVSCAQQWLRMKNWCPICKTSAESQPQPFS